MWCTFAALYRNNQAEGEALLASFNSLDISLIELSNEVAQSLQRSRAAMCQCHVGDVDRATSSAQNTNQCSEPERARPVCTIIRPSSFIRQLLRGMIDLSIVSIPSSCSATEGYP